MNLWRSLTSAQRVVLAGVLVGISAGASAFFFEQIVRFLFTHSDAWRNTLPRWPRVAVTVLLPAAGALIAGLLTEYFCPEARGHGSLEVRRALVEEGGRIRHRVWWVKFLASTFTIGSGGSAGREGPVIQIGASVGSTLGQWARVSSSQLRVLAAAGAAGGLAASFSVPLSGVFFIMEVLLKDFTNDAFPSVVVASVTGAVTASLMAGGKSPWPVLSYQWSGIFDFVNIAVIGLWGAPLGKSYMKLLTWSEGAFVRVERRAWLLPAFGGLAVGVIALWLPEVRGTGQVTITQALNGTFMGWRTAPIALAKLIASALTLGTGGSGGTLMPAMFIGATGGGAWGVALSALGLHSIPMGAFAIAGLSTVITAAYEAPITGMVMALEITHDYAILPPVMFGCILAYLVTRRKSFPSPERSVSP